MSFLAKSNIISFIVKCSCFFSCQITKTQRSSDSTVQWRTSSHGKETSDDWGSCVRACLKNKGFSDNVITSIFNSWRPGTRKQYKSAWTRWARWCYIRKCSAVRPSEASIVTFLQYLLNLEKSYSVISTHKAGILETLKLINSTYIRDFKVISRFMKGLSVLKAPRPRYAFTWDVSKVLSLLATWTPNESLSLKSVTLKLVTLLALSTAARAQTLVHMRVENIVFRPDKVVINCGDKLKGRKAGDPFLLEINKYNSVDICPVRILELYLRKTKDVRKDNQLLISFSNFKAVTTSTVARWLKTVLNLAGIDTNVFKAHSYRGASVSMAVRRGCSLQQVLKTADWKSAGNFRKFYYRDLQDNVETNFTQCVLSSWDSQS